MSLQGSKPFAVLICRAADSTGLPGLRAQVARVFSDLDVYWRDVSHGHIDLQGTKVFDGGVFSETLSELSVLDRRARVQRAIQAYPGVVFSDFFGVVAIVAAPADVGTMEVGPTTFWTAMGPAYLGWFCCGTVQLQEHSVLAHEMGHAFGLLHSFDRTGEYQDPLDVMSAANVDSLNHPPYIRMGPGLNSVNMDRLGWLDPARISEARDGGTVELQALNKPTRRGPCVLKLGTSRSFVEFRMNDGWDEGMIGPGGAVLFHWDDGAHSVVERNPVTGDPYFRETDTYYQTLNPIPLRPPFTDRPFSFAVEEIDKARRTVKIRYQFVHRGWTAIGYSDSRILWSHESGRISLWVVDDEGRQKTYTEHGPFEGWLPVSYSGGKILWRTADNRISLWSVDGEGRQTGYKEHGPLSGWYPLNYDSGKILWRHRSGKISLWNLDASGDQIGYKEYGPFSGWIPIQYVEGKILWRGADGRISLWSMDGAGNQTGFKEHGPFRGWAAINYSGGKILWRHASGKISLWSVDNLGNQTAYKEHGPAPGWTALGYHDGRILWRNPDGRISLWRLDRYGNQIEYAEHGPFD